MWVNIVCFPKTVTIEPRRMWQCFPDCHIFFCTGNNCIIQFAFISFKRQLITAVKPIALHNAVGYDGADGQTIYKLDSSFHIGCKTTHFVLSS